MVVGVLAIVPSSPTWGSCLAKPSPLSQCAAPLTPNADPGWGQAPHPSPALY
ncbi:hypothetical protein F751_4159 [Auxenochlorella protothecoides]|uniref:Uncharacterized protein n=1 Tax=Auxenochlorella protothecoides TaxID=3075 RepID=A0A087SJK3_AUXPR|nr:hypothetical protein F751_4159 [Auxenochlorella protothecoides]KFM25907.1 hypothetical protein F751_4159 [Auxenochlorella protothecoides]